MEILESALLRLHAALVDHPSENDDGKASPPCSPSLWSSPRWKNLVELSHAAQDACRDLANTQAFVRNRQQKLEDAVDHLRTLVCPMGAGEPGSATAAVGNDGSSTLQSPSGIIAAVESRLEQYRMETKCAEELLSLRTGELEALRRTSQRTLQDLTSLYKSRIAEANKEYQAQIRQANDRAELARNQSVGLQNQLESALAKLKTTEASNRALVAQQNEQMDRERDEWRFRVSSLERRLAEAAAASAEAKARVVDALAAKDDLAERLGEAEDQLAFTKEETKRELAELAASLDAFEAEIAVQDEVKTRQAERLSDLEAILALRDVELSHLQSIAEAKEAALTETREGFNRHRRLLETEIANLRRRTQMAEDGRDEAERELRRMQLEQVGAGLSDEGHGGGVGAAAVDLSSSSRGESGADDLGGTSSSTRPSSAGVCDKTTETDMAAAESASVAALRAEFEERLRVRDLETENLRRALRERQIDLELACSLISAGNGSVGGGGGGTPRGRRSEGVPRARPADEAAAKTSDRKMLDLTMELEKVTAEKEAALAALACARSEAHKGQLALSEAEEAAKTQRRSCESLQSQLRYLAKGTMALYNAFEESKQNAALVALGQQLQNFELDSVLATSSGLRGLDSLLSPLKSMPSLTGSEQDASSPNP